MVLQMLCMPNKGRSPCEAGQWTQLVPGPEESWLVILIHTTLATSPSVEVCCNRQLPHLSGIQWRKGQPGTCNYFSHVRTPLQSPPLQQTSPQTLFFHSYRISQSNAFCLFVCKRCVCMCVCICECKCAWSRSEDNFPALVLTFLLHFGTGCFAAVRAKLTVLS